MLKFKKIRPRSRGLSKEKIQDILSKFSKAIMLPVATLAPAGIIFGVAAIVMKYTGSDTSWLKWFKAIGLTPFRLLPLLFSISVVLAFTNNSGVAALSAAIGYYSMNLLMEPFINIDSKNHVTQIFGVFTIDSEKIAGNVLGVTTLQTSVFGGLSVGFLVAWIYNRFNNIKLPSAIAFFGGERFVAIATMFFVVPLSFLFLLVWPWIGQLIAKFGKASATWPGGTDSLIYGLVERSLVPFGLHHVFVAPFLYSEAGGSISPIDTVTIGGHASTLKELGIVKSVSGDRNIWFEVLAADTKLDFNVLGQLDVNPGRFLQGKFPFMMFGLPAGAAAMIMAAPKEKRKTAFGIVGSAALTSFLTGITEPLEYSFLFLAPVLFWGFHAIMAGISFMLMNILGAHVGSTFSGGILDLLFYGIVPEVSGKSTGWYWAIVIGIAYAPIYYFVFYLYIKKFNIATPGRVDGAKLVTKKEYLKSKKSKNSYDINFIEDFFKALGGKNNIIDLDNCATRLRLRLVDSKKMNKEKLKLLGAHGFVGKGNSIQVIIGPTVINLAKSLRDVWK